MWSLGWIFLTQALRIFYFIDRGKTKKERQKAVPGYAKLGASLFEIAQSLCGLERTFILGAMALNWNKSDERTDKIQILSSSLMSNKRIKHTVKMVEKRIKMHDLYIF